MSVAAVRALRRTTAVRAAAWMGRIGDDGMGRRDRRIAKRRGTARNSVFDAGKADSGCRDVRYRARLRWLLGRREAIVKRGGRTWRPAFSESSRRCQYRAFARYAPRAASRKMAEYTLLGNGESRGRAVLCDESITASGAASCFDWAAQCGPRFPNPRDSIRRERSFSPPR